MGPSCLIFSSSCFQVLLFIQLLYPDSLHQTFLAYEENRLPVTAEIRVVCTAFKLRFNSLALELNPFYLAKQFHHFFIWYANG